MNEKEEWRWVDGFETRYEVSNLGRVRSWFTCRNTLRKQPRVLKPWITNVGYPVVGLSAPEVKERFLVHRLVAQAFVPNPKEKPHVNHKDSNRANANADNLEWVTRSENQKHACKFGYLRPPTLRGEQSPNSKLTDDKVREIRRVYRFGSKDANQRVLANRYGVDQQVIWAIVTRKTWTHLD